MMLSYTDLKILYRIVVRISETNCMRKQGSCEIQANTLNIAQRPHIIRYMRRLRCTKARIR